MNFDLKTLDLQAAASEKCDLLVVLVDTSFKSNAGPLADLITQAIKAKDFEGKQGQSLSLYQPQAASARRVLLLAWVLHGALLAYNLLDVPPRFGFAPALSIIVWLALTVYAVESQLYPQMRARWALAGFGAVAVVLALLFPGSALPHTSSPLLPLHWALGIAAYGMFAAAVAHGVGELALHCVQHLLEDRPYPLLGVPR